MPTTSRTFSSVVRAASTSLTVALPNWGRPPVWAEAERLLLPSTAAATMPKPTEPRADEVEASFLFFIISGWQQARNPTDSR